MKTIRVVAAIIRKGDKIFATQRGYGDFKDGWEFPGGKIEEGESPEHAIAREIKEELNADIIVGDLLTTVEYDYPNFHLSMDCFWAELAPDSHMKLLEHEAAKWLSIDEIDSVDWLPADVEVVKKIKGIIDLCAYQKGILMQNNYLEIPVNCDLHINTRRIERFQSLFRAYNDKRIANKIEYINLLAAESADTLKEIDKQIFKSIVDGIKERGMFNSANEKVVYKVYVDISDCKRKFIEIMRNIKSFLSTNCSYFELYKSDIRNNNNNQPILFKSKWNDTNTVQRIIILDSDLDEFSEYIFL